MKRSIGPPSASPRRQRNTCSAARLKTRMFCAASTVMMASMAESTIDSRRTRLASVLRSATRTSRAVTKTAMPTASMSATITAPTSHGASVPRMKARALNAARAASTAVLAAMVAGCLRTFNSGLSPQDRHFGRRIRGRQTDSSFDRGQYRAIPGLHSSPMHHPASDLVIDPVLIRKHDVGGPRYTSYPTADRFVDAFGEFDLRQWLAKRNIGGISLPLSVYVHLPFCDTLCYYCGCNKVVTRDHSRSAKYIKYLQKELELLGPLLGSDRGVSQMHWG